MNNKVKSAVAAGLLGIFLGAFGAHNWYLGEKKKGIIHLCLLGGAILLVIIATITAVGSVASSASALYNYSASTAAASLVAGTGLSLVFYALAALLAAGNSIWGLVEGIIILVKGDAGLAQKGYNTATVAAVQPNWQNNAGEGTVASEAVASADATQASSSTGTSTTSQPAAPQTVAQQVAPKAPMDPAKKSQLAKIIALIVAGVVVAVVAIVVVVIVSQVDYGETYRVAKEMKSDMSAFYSSNPCERVMNYYNSSSVSKAKFGEYVADCLEIGGSIKKEADVLKETSAVKKDKDIKAQFEVFYTGIDQVLPSTSELEQKLDMLEAWHNFVVTTSSQSLNYSSPDSALRAYVSDLTNSGFDVLKNYAEGWLERQMNVSALYRAYDVLSFSDSNKSAARRAYDEANNELKNWIAENRPSMDELAKIDTSNVGKLYKEWNKLYEMISELYEAHYVSGSGDCTEFLGVVECS